MTDEITSPQANTKHNIFDQTLGDILTNNPTAQQMIMKSMGISQENFQNMLNSAQQNNLMHMKIGDLFKNGIVQQAVQQNPSSNPGQIVQQQQIQQVQQKTSFMDKVKSWF